MLKSLGFSKLRTLTRKQMVASIIVSYFIFSVVFLFTTEQVKTGLDWRTASRASAGLTPLPSQLSDAIVQVYTARAFSWRGIFGVHSWVALKPANAKQYTTLQVIGWRQFSGKSVVAITDDIPDRLWYQAKPEIIYELRGQKATLAIPELLNIAENYPFHNTYHVWPGPNSNTFVAHLIRESQFIKTELPPTAIGKDYLPFNHYFSTSLTGTGLQFSALGVFGFTIGRTEGIDINILGLNAGIALFPPAFKLPLLGRIGF